jgi:hypothetical protein
LSQAAQNDIPSKLAAWRAVHRLGAGASLEQARAVDPVGWAVLEADLIAVVIGMPAQASSEPVIPDRPEVDPEAMSIDTSH